MLVLTVIFETFWCYVHAWFYVLFWHLKDYLFSGYIKRLMRETGEEIEELTNEIRHDIEVNWSVHTTVFACYFASPLSLYTYPVYIIYSIHPCTCTSMSMLKAFGLLTFIATSYFVLTLEKNNQLFVCINDIIIIILSFLMVIYSTHNS